MQLWSTLAGHKHANIFRHPVTNAVADGYEDIIRRRMDLGTMKHLIETGVGTACGALLRCLVGVWAMQPTAGP